MLLKSSSIGISRKAHPLSEMRRRKFLRCCVWPVAADVLVSCDSRDSSDFNSTFDSCDGADYSLLYFGFTGEDFAILNTCGSDIAFSDRRFSALAPIRLLCVGNGGDRLLISYLYDIIREKDSPIYIYNMVDFTYQKLYGFTDASECRISADGNVITGVRDPGPGNRGPSDTIDVFYASLSPPTYEKFTLRLQEPNFVPRNIGLSADGKVVVFSVGNNMWHLDPSDGAFHFLGAGKRASCSPDGTRIACTGQEGKLVIQSVVNPVEREVLGLSAVDGLEWYPTGDFGAAAAPSWIPPLGFPRPDNLYFVDVNGKRWRRLTLQRGWIGATSLRWIKKSIHLPSVLDRVHKDIVKESDPEDWFNYLMQMQNQTGN